MADKSKSLGVLIPTRNNGLVTAAHAATLMPWLDLASEVIVVDSESTDATVALLKGALTHPNIKFLSHPPGLYQSWNFGIQRLSTDYAYISTVGECMTREGLRHLMKVAQSYDADVVMSRPQFVDLSGAVVPKDWPIHSYLETRPEKEPFRLTPEELFLLSVMYVPESIAGSVASNLFRTSTLRKFPWPTDYGHLGDEAWFIEHAFEAVVAITPEVFSSFLIHPSGNQMEPHVLNRLVKRLHQLACDALARRSATASTPEVEAFRLATTQVASMTAELEVVDGRLTQARTGIWPWYLNPEAWKARKRRDQLRVSLTAASHGLITRHRVPARLVPATTFHALPRLATLPPIVSEAKETKEEILTAAPPVEPETDPVVAVFVCTHNPQAEHLGETLAALERQTLPRERWELFLVDNASTPPLEGRYDLSWHPRGKLLREEKIGKVNALRLAFKNSTAKFIAVIDDDNVVDPDYVEQVASIGRRHPWLGVWGGHVELKFQTPPEEWTRKYWPFLAEQLVPEDLLLPKVSLCGPLPVGAGCCFRRAALTHYFSQIQSCYWRQRLGRTGESLISGEDTDMVLSAGDIGLGCGFFKDMRMKHLIPPSRLTVDYLARLVEGIRFSIHVLIMSRDPRNPPPPTDLKWHAKFFVDRTIKFGRRRRFYVANKNAQRKARALYEELYQKNAARPLEVLAERLNI